MMPSYGLSENSVGLCIPPVDRGPIERDGVYSVGSALGGHEVRVLDDFGRLCRDGESGRLQFRGESQMRGYWNNDAATAAVTRDGWIDTGDVAFEASGEIYIVGRSKDVIIRNGRQLPVEPIETAVRNGRRASGFAAWRSWARWSRPPGPRSSWCWPNARPKKASSREY